VAGTPNTPEIKLNLTSGNLFAWNSKMEQTIADIDERANL
jgi:hypothetical protein